MDALFESSAEGGDPESDHIDITGLPLRELISPENSILASALDRLLQDLDAHHEVMVAFQSFAG